MLVSAFSFCMLIFAVEFDSVESVAVIPVAEEDTGTANEAELTATPTNLWPNETFSEVDYTGLFGKYLGNSNGYTQIQAPSFGDATNLCMKLSFDAPFF